MNSKFLPFMAQLKLRASLQSKLKLLLMNKPQFKVALSLWYSDVALASIVENTLLFRVFWRAFANFHVCYVCACMLS